MIQLGVRAGFRASERTQYDATLELRSRARRARQRPAGRGSRGGSAARRLSPDAVLARTGHALGRCLDGPRGRARAAQRLPAALQRAFQGGRGAARARLRGQRDRRRQRRGAPSSSCAAASPAGKAPFRARPRRTRSTTSARRGIRTSAAANRPRPPGSASPRRRGATPAILELAKPLTRPDLEGRRSATVFGGLSVRL